MFSNNTIDPMTDHPLGWPSLQDIAEAYISHDPDRITEATMSRVWQHHAQTGHKSFAIMTSWRGDASHEHNLNNWESFKQELKDHGHGYSLMRGKGQEEHPSDPNKTISTWEPSAMVHGISLEHAKALGKKHNQWGIMYSGPETGGNTHMVELGPDKHTDLGKFHAKRMGDYWTSIRFKGKKFLKTLGKPVHDVKSKEDKAAKLDDIDKGERAFSVSEGVDEHPTMVCWLELIVEGPTNNRLMDLAMTKAKAKK
jgi:hypothetical protein